MSEARQHPPGQQQEAVEAAAVAWFALLRDETADADRRARFAAWRAADPRHDLAWREIQQLWNSLDGLDGLADEARSLSLADHRRPPSPASAAGPRARRAVPRRDQLRAERRPAPRRLGRRALAAAVLLLAVTLGAAGFWAAQPPGFATALLADLHTGRGERRTVDLPDGSTVELGAASSLSLAFGEGARGVVLHGGEAWFSVAHDPARPFVVEAGDGRVTVLGTAFEVRSGDAGTRVAVASGRVAVAPAAGPEVRLAPGQGLRYDSAGAGAPYPVALADLGAWRRDRLVFEATPLGEVLSDLERYRRGRILVTDPAVAALPVTGVFDTRRPDAALATIARSLPVELLELTELLVLVRPSGRPRP